ncbi:HNH endonuclease [Facklamia sp. P12945]|uniref:HNH endonuclease n=1 Tax=unclassified Facklamia TaxID=2622293 RepID=UPI003D1680F3
MENFVKIPASDTRFIHFKARLKNELEIFYNYILNHTNTNLSSGKSRSYTNYLIRLGIISEKTFNYKINSFFDLNTFHNISRLNTDFHESFRIYNLAENRYPNATLNSYMHFFKFYYFLTESQEDSLIIELSNSFNTSDKKIPEGKLEKKPKKYDSKTIPRNSYYAQKAKENAGWKCEVNKKHKTFLTKNNKPYMEAHHLLPMFAELNYDYSIDFPENIVCLCPTCHMQLHHGRENDKKTIIKKLYNERKDFYKKRGIDLTLSELLEYY